MPLKLTTYHRGSRIPELPGTDTFHSTELFHVYEATPGYAPLLIVVVGKRNTRSQVACRHTEERTTVSTRHHQAV